MKVIAVHSVCQDCLYFIEFGYVDDPDPTWEQSEAEAFAVDRFMHTHSGGKGSTTPELEEEFPELTNCDQGGQLNEFSSKPCDCCGSSLAGGRWAIVEMGSEEKANA